MPKGLAAARDSRDGRTWISRRASRSWRKSGFDSRFRAATETLEDAAAPARACAATSRGSRPCCVNVNWARRRPR